MRPLKLELSGFTCFRDFTRIDFTNLELFAIVGQTGAGKSSILDALTFALYEQTPRLGNKPAKELIAQGSTGMSLSLEFEASDGRTYRVARSHSSKGSEVRFERLEAEKWVTAVSETKKKEVAEAIERTVGLDFDGFTRAVLLPQGEFDRFLRGEPSKRRELLKNLIGLERIEQMQKRSNELARDAKSKSEALQIQLDGLSHATPAALEELEQNQLQTQANLTQTLKQLEVARLAFGEALEIEKLERAIIQIQLEQQRLAAQQPEVEHIRQQSIEARKVEQILPILEQLQRLEQKIQVSQHETSQTQAQLKAAQQLEENAQIALEAARDAALETPNLEEQILQLSALLPRVERLKSLGGSLSHSLTNPIAFSESAWSELERLSAELPLLERTAKELHDLERQQSELGLADQRLFEAQQALHKRREALEHAQVQAQNALEAIEHSRAAALEIPKIESSLRSLEALKPKLSRLLELGGYLGLAIPNASVFSEKAWARLETIESEIKTHSKLQKQQQSLKADREAARDDLLHWEAQLLESNRNLEHHKTKEGAAGSKQQDLEIALEAAKRENLAAELVRGLELGDPCPVCGEPLTRVPEFANARVPALEQDLASIRLQLERLRQELTSLQLAQNSHALKANQAEQNLQRLEETLRQTNLERKQLEEQWQGVLTNPSDPQSSLQAARAALLSGLAAELSAAGATELEQQIKLLQNQKAKLEQAERQAVVQHSQASANLAGCQSQLEAAQQLLESRQSEQEKANEAKHRLNKRREDIEAERQVYLNKLRIKLGSADSPAKTLQAAKTALLAGLAAELQQAGATPKLESKIGDLKTKRQNLEQAERQAREVYSSAKTHTARLQSAYVATQKSLEDLQLEGQTLLSAVGLQLVELGYSSAQAAKDKALSKTEIQQLEQQVQQFEQHQMALYQRHNENLLALRGRSLEVPLRDLEQQVQNLEQESQGLLGRLGQQTAQKAQLEQQIAQAKALRREQNALEKRFDTYGALALDMKGNEFQDYLLSGVQQQLLQRASQTMQVITRERYSLALIDTEFQVRDAWNGLEARGVKTLSGGESFIASLALALSLSDYLAGNQALGALFLDEGFGTLDADALEMVANTLETLNTTGRMVGVITHVQALADRLPTRLHIEKSQDSSRARWES